ncbi:MAG: hypothetical protein UR26_C0005G0014 [candidate division TM6 bacterium GW2011_GWF2_32_72]|nr:MAG: hypothetical protein UR26_C0005G0014 [candidate division TM6 bacterium GW2011_GWF2_32_72]
MKISLSCIVVWLVAALGSIFAGLKLFPSLYPTNFFMNNPIVEQTLLWIFLISGFFSALMFFVVHFKGQCGGCK